MIKKILILLLLFWFSLSQNVSAKYDPNNNVKNDSKKQNALKWKDIDYQAIRDKLNDQTLTDNYIDSKLNDGLEWDITRAAKEVQKDQAKKNAKKTEEPKICDWWPTDKINCASFTIDAGNFSPGSKKILNNAKSWNWDTVESANAILWTIIKNLIVVFWALSLLMMTIGGWMMIFHAGQESILTKWKWIFVWWVASLAIWLSAGLIVKIVSYVLY